ncbi:MAG: DUF2934 domain-containing protein [Candidatus Obscuribacterales bacterium]|nr:DUF2934 domain-containing protein [Candidatus Obscuribacterales bacterium]
MATKKTESSAKQTKAGTNSTKTTTTKAVLKKPEASVEVEATVTSPKAAVLEAPAVKIDITLDTAPAVKEPKKQITLDHIAARAYLLWLERGCEHGYDVIDWLRAEAELKERN